MTTTLKLEVMKSILSVVVPYLRRLDMKGGKHQR